MLVSALAATGLASCQKGPVVVTSDGAGNIRGVDGIALGSALTGPPAGFHRDHTSLMGTTYVKSEDVTLAGVGARKEVQVVMEGGAVDGISYLLVPSSEADSEKLSRKVLAGLEAEYGATLQQQPPLRAMVTDEARNVLIFGGGPKEISLHIRRP
jgi:hypothetical protein